MLERVYLARDSPGKTEKSVAPALAIRGAASTLGTGLATGALGSDAGAVDSAKRGGRDASAEAYLESGNPRPRPRRRRERRPRSPPRSGRSPRSVRSVWGAAADSPSIATAPLSTSRSSGGSAAEDGAIGLSAGGRFLPSPREASPREDSPRGDSPRPGSRVTDTRSKSSVSSEKSET